MVKYLCELFISQFKDKYLCLNVVSRIMDIKLCINVMERFIFLLKNVTMRCKQCRCIIVLMKSGYMNEIRRVEDNNIKVSVSLSFTCTAKSFLDT